MRMIIFHINNKQKIINLIKFDEYIYIYIYIYYKCVYISCQDMCIYTMSRHGQKLNRQQITKQLTRISQSISLRH